MSRKRDESSMLYIIDAGIESCISNGTTSVDEIEGVVTPLVDKETYTYDKCLSEVIRSRTRVALNRKDMYSINKNVYLDIHASVTVDQFEKMLAHFDKKILGLEGSRAEIASEKNRTIALKALREALPDYEQFVYKPEEDGTMSMYVQLTKAQFDEMIQKYVEQAKEQA